MTTATHSALHFDWLHDDLEEDFVGADWHQDAIHALSASLETLRDERGWPWHVGNELTMIGSKPDGTDWRPGPDVSVHPTLGPARRQDIDLRVDGPLALAVEVASKTTWRYDVSLERTWRGKRQAGKAYGYLVLLEVPEYLVFDPHGEFLPTQVQAWRRVGVEVREWRPEADGRYHSAELGIALQPDGPFLRVYDPQGKPVPYWFETARENRALRRDIDQQASENVALRHANDEQARRIAALEAQLERLCGSGEQG